MSSESVSGAGTPQRDAAAAFLSAAGNPSIWSHKPWWCQPWSILLTGVAVVTLSWLLFGRWWLSLGLLIGVLLWWWVFLVLVPAAWLQEVQAARLAQPAFAQNPSPEAGGGD